MFPHSQPWTHNNTMGPTVKMAHSICIIANFQLTQFLFSNRTHYLISKCMHRLVVLKMRCGRAHCYLEAAENDCITDQQ